VAPLAQPGRRTSRQSDNPAASDKNQPIHSTMVTVLSSPTSQSRRGSATNPNTTPYDYTEAATGLEKVPIPVWAVRSFTASWTAPLPAKKPIEAALRQPRDEFGTIPLGEITNNLPVPIEDVVLF